MTILHLSPPEASDPSPRYATVSQRVRARADRRLQAVLSYREAFGLTCGSIAERDATGLREPAWLDRFRAEHPGMRVSLSSVRRWAEALDAGGIDALCDGNDGGAHHGVTSIPQKARDLFKVLYLDANCRKVSLCIQEVRKVGEVEGWELPVDRAFYRFANSIPELTRKLRREYADKPSNILPYVERDYDSESAFRIIQADHHQLDVAVRCGDHDCQRGHYPWWSPFVDIRSRKVLGWEVAIDPPNYRRIRSVFLRVLADYGLPQVVYIDNGKDFKKAFGRRRVFRHFELGSEGRPQLVTWDGPDELETIVAPLGVSVTYARPYNAQAKLIERMFRSFITRFCEHFDAYRGRLGRRTERARELYEHPEKLLPISEFALALDQAVVEYDATPHRGQGMGKRSPDEVFVETRIPRRDPDPKALALVFFDEYARRVDRNGVRIEHRHYRLLEAAAHAELFGKTVTILVNPENVNEAVVLNGRREVVCQAALRELATSDPAEPITREVIRATEHEAKELRRMATLGDAEAAEALALYRADRLTYYARKADERAAAQQLVASAGGGAAAAVPVIIPTYSRMARSIERIPRLSISAADLELAASVPPADERIAALFEAGRRESGTEDLTQHYARERARLRRLRKVERGLCGEENCERRATTGVNPSSPDYCQPCWLQITGGEDQ